MECPLGSGSDQEVDLSAKLTSLEALDPRGSLAEIYQAWMPWWQADIVPSVWLEFDLARQPDPAPVICWTLPRPLDQSWFLDQLAPSLIGRPLPPSWRANIERCLDALPKAAYPLYAYDLRARSLDALRLEFFGLSPDAVAPYLRQIAPEQERHNEWLKVGKWVFLLHDVDRLHLSFEINDVIGTRIGLEGSYRRLPSREPRWRQLALRLVEKGLCTEAQMEAIFRWPGQDEKWVRLLSHFKLVVSRDQPTLAKVYLLLQAKEAALRSVRGEEATQPSPATRG